MKRLITVIIVICTLVVGIAFSQLNSSSVRLDYYLGVLSAPLSTVVMVTLAIGCLLGITVSFIVLLSLRGENVRLRRKIALREQELKNLREIPIKGTH